MNFWKRRGDEAATAQTMQLRDRERHPYAGLRSFMPQRGGELRLYQAESCGCIRRCGRLYRWWTPPCAS